MRLHEFHRATIHCETCGCRFVRSVKRAGWIDSIPCPDCDNPLQLDTGPNAARVAHAQLRWQREYQRIHYPNGG